MAPPPLETTIRSLSYPSPLVLLVTLTRTKELNTVFNSRSLGTGKDLGGGWTTTQKLQLEYSQVPVERSALVPTSGYTIHPMSRGHISS